MARPLTALPKAHLHLHFTGAMRHATLVALARERRVHLPDALASGWPPQLSGTDERGRQPDAVPLGQLDQRPVPHRPGEVQVQVRLGELGERPGHPASVPYYLASVSSLAIRLMPSSRSASPSAHDSRK